MPRKKTTAAKATKKAAPRNMANTGKRLAKQSGTTNPANALATGRRLAHAIHQQSNVAEPGTITARNLPNRPSLTSIKGGSHEAEPSKVQPIPMTMSRITIAQDNLDAMIDALYSRLAPLLSAPQPEGDEGAEAEMVVSDHHRDLHNHLCRTRQQDERLGKLIDRLTI